MKSKRSEISSQILVLAMAAFVILLMVSAARAQSSDNSSTLVAQANNQNSQYQNNQAQVLQLSMPQKSLGRRLWENTSLSYYQQFLGPTPSGSPKETYNVFQEGIDQPGTGRAPLQSFHAANLRHQINTDWAIGATLSATNGYTDTVENRNDEGAVVATNTSKLDFFNARAYVSLPPVRFDSGTWYSTLSYEAPTSNTSKDLEMRYGWVAASSYAFNLPDPSWNAGFIGQIYRMYYKRNVTPPPCPVQLGCTPTALQTMIISGGPYVNYRFNDRWMLGSIITLDWDQRGVQSGSTQFNNNLPHRGRVNLTYFPQQIKYLQSVGLFTQALLKYRHETTAIGADFAVRF
jgi:hypothetical protein